MQILLFIFLLHSGNAMAEKLIDNLIIISFIYIFYKMSENTPPTVKKTIKPDVLDKVNQPYQEKKNSHNVNIEFADIQIEEEVLDKFIIGEKVLYIDKKRNGFVYDVDGNIIGLWNNCNIIFFDGKKFTNS